MFIPDIGFPFQSSPNHSLDHDSGFKYLGVNIDANSRYKKCFKYSQEFIKLTSKNATHKQATSETITTVMLTPILTPYKHHLNLKQSTFEEALYMADDTGEWDYTALQPELDDQIGN